ncbi:MAG: CRTAC1 family protein, partial [Acidobacteriota bacterium]
DILVLRGAWLRSQGRQPNSLLLNDGNGRFEDVTEEAGLLSFAPTQVGIFADVDGDGWLDLFVGNESSRGAMHPCELYRNLGPGADGRPRFVDVAARAGLDLRAPIKGAAWGDVDNDGWPDLFLSRLGMDNLLLRHSGRVDADGVPRFEDITARAGVAAPRDSFPAAFFDADHDGRLDLFVGGFASDFVEARAESVIADYLGAGNGTGHSVLYRNRGDGTFETVDGTALDASMLVMGANVGDLDNDGFEDLYLGTGAPDFRALVPNRALRNVGGADIVDVTTAAGLGHLQKGHGIAFADVDADGDQDVLAVMGGAFSGDVYPNALFLNPGTDHRYVTLRLEGVTAPRSPIGARLRLDLETPSGPRQIHRLVSTGGSFGSSSLQQEIGLGDATALRRLEVRWPGGGPPTVLNDLALDATYVVRQGEESPRRLDVAPIPLPAAEPGAGGHSGDH